MKYFKRYPTQYHYTAYKLVNTTVSNLNVKDLKNGKFFVSLTTAAGEKYNTFFTEASKVVPLYKAQRNNATVELLLTTRKEDGTQWFRTDFVEEK